MASNATDAGTMLVEQAGQVLLHGTSVGVHRTLADEYGPYAVLRLRADGADPVDVLEAAPRPGEELLLPDGGVLEVIAVRASTADRRGAVLLRVR
ncbi:hypothetical protein ACXET9_15540 [Brachybacterium sp. DNPG3]